MDVISAWRSPSRSGQRWFIVGLLVVFVAVSVQYTFKILDDERDNRSAFLRWRDQILEVQQGVNIYDQFNYPNPPIMFLILEPFALLAPSLGALAWFYAKVAMAALAILWAFRLVEDPARPFPAWGKALAVLLSLRPIVGDLSHGNVNLFILFLVVGALYAYRRRQDFGAGLILALAIACKVTPALFIPYFLWKRGWRVLAGSGVGLVLFLWVIPGAFLGMGRNQELLESWVERMILPYVAQGEVTSEHNNQSLPGLIQRLFTESPSFTTFVDHEYVPVEFHNILSLDGGTAGWIVKSFQLLFVVVVIWSCRTPTTQRQNWRLGAEFSLVLLAMLLFSERTWKHHCVTLILPFALMCYYLSALRPSRPLRAYLIGTVVLVVLLMTTTSTGLVDQLERAAKIAQTYGAYVWAYVLLMIALVVLLRRPTTPSVAEAVRDQASTSDTTWPSGTSGNGRPIRSVSIVSGSMPMR
jgi:alpha-1,2-mannosyltransferase